MNGVKKWISNGKFADYFVTAVRTGDSGIFGISLLLIERVKYFNSTIKFVTIFIIFFFALS